MSLPALVPAAGRSSRMGRPKLILPLAGQTVIARVVSALVAGGADPVLVIAPPRDQPGAVVLAEQAAASGALVEHCPAATTDMRQTIELGLEVLRREAPEAPGILLLPGDSPGVTAELVRAILREFLAHPDQILVPVHQGRRGHPVALPRHVCDRIPALPGNVGVNSLLRDPSTAIQTFEHQDSAMLHDLDSPEDYQRWLSRS